MTNIDNFVPEANDAAERSFGRFEFTSLETVRNRLINLSRTNRLINFQDSRALPLVEQNLASLVKKFSQNKDYSLLLFKRLTFAQFLEYFAWLEQDPVRKQTYLRENEKFSWLKPELEVNTQVKKYARENTLQALTNKDNELQGGEDFIELSTEEQEFADLDQDEQLNDAQNLANEEKNTRFSLLPYLEGEKLTPEVIIPLLLTDSNARENYLSGRDPQAFIPEILEKGINLESYATFALEYESKDLGVEESKNPQLKLPKASSLQVCGWQAKAGKQLDNFYRNNQKSIREIGAGILYLTVGLVEYLDTDNTNCFAPLYLIPVNLNDKSSANGVQMSISYTGEDIIENVSFAEKLRLDFNTYLPRVNIAENLWQEEKKLKQGIKTSFTLEQIKEQLAKVNKDATYSFIEYLALVEQSLQEQGFKFCLHEQAFLATYQFAKQRMYLDLDPEEWPSHARLENNQLINTLFNEKTGDKDYVVGVENNEYAIDQIENIHELYPLLDEADSSQHSALIDVIQGKNLVIEGPPGSGKSQTITNMIAAAMKQGKKVLFIAEKLAAQEGVLRRLRGMGLGDFCLDLHDNHIAKKAVFESIEQRLSSLGKYVYPEGLPNAIAQYEQYKEILNAYAEQINAPYLNSGFTNQEILAAAGYYKQFNFVNGGIGLFNPQVTEDEVAQKFFTRDNYDNIITELNSFTTVINKVKASLILQSRYLRQTQQEQDPIMAIVAKADSFVTQDVNQIKGLGSFSFKGNYKAPQVNLHDPKLAHLRIRDHLWYGVTAKELNSFDSAKIIESLYNWQKSLVEIKDFLQTLLRTHQVEPEAINANGELAPSGADAQDLELAHLDLLSLDIFAQKFSSLPLAKVNDFVDLTLLQELLHNPLEEGSLFNNLQHDLEHLERYLGFSAAQGQGLFNYTYLDCLEQKKRFTGAEVDFSKVSLIPELRNKHYSLAERQRLLSHPEIGKLFAHLIKTLPLVEQHLINSGDLTQLNRFEVSLENYLKRDQENQKSATEFLNYLTTKLSGTLELNYQQLVDLASLLSELPASLVKYRSINFLSPILETNYQELAESIEQLRYEINSLQMDFDLGHLASYEEFVEMRKAIINKPNFIMRLFDSKYKNAKRRFLLLTRGIDYDDIAVERILARIDSYYAKLRLLENSQTFKDFFGALYQGAETNLNNIKILCEWSNKVANYCRNELSNSQVSPVLAYLLNEEEFFAVVEIGKTIASDFDRLRQASDELNTYLVTPIKNYGQLVNLAQILLPEIQILNKLIRTNFKVVDLQTTLQDGLALFHEQMHKERRFSSHLINELDLETISTYEASLSVLHSYLVNPELSPATSQRLFQEHPRLMVIVNTWYLAQQFIGLARLVGELKASNMQAIAGNFEQVSDLQKQSQVGLSLKEVLRIARMQQTQVRTTNVSKLNITARGILLMFKAFQGFKDFVQAQEKISGLSASIKQARQAFADFVQLTSLQDQLWIGESTNSLLDLIVRNQLALDCADGLIEWIDYLRATESLDNLGIGKISHYAEQVANLSSAQLAEMFSQVFFNFLAWKVIERSPVLRDFSSINHNAVVEKFNQADQNLKLLQRQNTAYAIDLNTQTLPGVESKRPAELTEMALLRYVANHKNMRASLRDVIFRAGASLQALKPCFMMSPASVAQFLTPGGLDFDLMIMDEASQVTPEDALGAIARSKQVVIVGDPKQLPPTNFFGRVTSGGDDDNQLITQTAKSILDVATTIFPTRILRWHYRSQHESLIAFSNQRYYGSKLIAFPSPYAQHPDYGVKFFKVEGTFHYQRANPQEAKVVAQAMVEHLVKHQDQTLGAVAMNQCQATIIEREFMRLLEKNPQAMEIYRKYERTLEPVFVKNLENVQGDERDVIMISCTYAPVKLGNKLPQRFGPINGAAGGKRLNVLFTRSKKRMEVFCSFNYQEIQKRNETAESGVNDLRSFLKYAQTGVLEQNSPRVLGKERLSTANYISHSLMTELGTQYTISTEVGSASYRIDMAFAPLGNSTYILGLETDGQMYAEAKSARDRDRLRAMVLRRLGWQLERIWTVDWYKYSQQEITADLKNMLDQLN
ncbi:DUF4011 domain-containing protein [Psittacicella gerlachiana]|uniref:AAA domain-containing protein n=1 Tax=Psittacicella gerlachiana TaxID=2028574 RepID=A0A3A1YKQ6_9GAMM|nr:DUF4011 domain-containing protein [Psittacicella gerlachiana]RIY37798.1 hypothetical protein CKF59_01500 [Psittacicella gerlachiana]